MKRIASLAVVALAICGTAQAQVVARPKSNDPTPSSTITTGVGGAFQSVLAANPNRFGCAVQNNSAHTIYVFFGVLASATTGKSAVLTPGATAYCNVGPVVLIDQVSVSGTSGDAFYASQQ